MIRVIPTLLIQNKGLIKTQNFKNPVYLGDPINAVKIFNEKEVDELVLMDIGVTASKDEPKYDWIKDIVSESFMPIGYGGGISNINHAKRLFDLGIEKVIINSASEDFKFIEELAKIYGNQSVVICIDVKKNFYGNYNAFKLNGKIKIKDNPLDFARKLVDSGAGEIIIQSIDKEGSMKGYDLNIIKLLSSSINVPIVASGGAGSLENFKEAIKIGGASAVTAGSFFVFKGKQRGILINYPNQNDLKSLFN